MIKKLSWRDKKVIHRTWPGLRSFYHVIIHRSSAKMHVFWRWLINAQCFEHTPYIFKELSSLSYYVVHITWSNYKAMLSLSLTVVICCFITKNTNQCYASLVQSLFLRRRASASLLGPAFFCLFLSPVVDLLSPFWLSVFCQTLTRFSPDSRQILTRFLPDSRQILARFLPDSRQILARFLPD